MFELDSTSKGDLKQFVNHSMFFFFFNGKLFWHRGMTLSVDVKII